MWSSKELVIISIATGLVFCLATMYAQSAVSKYVDRRVLEKSGGNPLIGMGLASEPREQQPHQHQHQHQNQTQSQEEGPHVGRAPGVADVPPPGSGTRWTPVPT